VYVYDFFCVRVQVEALRRANHPSKKSYQLSSIKKLRKFSPMLQSGSKLPSVGATRKKKNVSARIIWELSYSVSTKSLPGLKNCGAQTNWASHMRFAADHSETLEIFYWPQ
jgi:hypothetical protein